MARVDKIFQDNLALIMSQPWEEVKRPVYGDGTGVKVKRILQVCNQYDLRLEFPLGSLRPTNLKNSIKEILWIWQKRSVDIKDLGLHIWDQWADDNGKIEGCYGDMVNRHVYMGTGKAPEGMIDIHDGLYGFLNQTDFILWSLKNDRSSRRIVASMFDPETNGLKPLQECAFQVNLSVKGDELYMTLYQRSQDAIVAGLWNVAQYAALMMMFAHDAGLKPAIFTHFIQDMHVYDRHEEQASQIHKQKIPKGGIKRLNQSPFEVFGFRLFDRVMFENSYYFIFGRRKTGSFNIRDIDGKNQKNVTYKKLKLSRCKRFMIQKEMN